MLGGDDDFFGRLKIGFEGAREILDVDGGAMPKDDLVGRCRVDEAGGEGRGLVEDAARGELGSGVVAACSVWLHNVQGASKDRDETELDIGVEKIVGHALDDGFQALLRGLIIEHAW